MKRGTNLKRGQRAGDRGRVLGGKACMRQPAPPDCACRPDTHCADRGYTTMAQHLGHRGLARAADNRGVSVDTWCKHLIAKNDPYPGNGAHRQWLIARVSGANIEELVTERLEM